MNEETAHIEATQADQRTERRSTRVRTFVEYLKTVLMTLAVALFLKAFVVEAFRIPSSSMEATLLVGDFLLVNKLAYGIRTPRFIPLTNFTVPTWYAPIFRNVKRGDVVVFEFPGSMTSAEGGEPVNYIKRCVGLPGDVVEIRDGQVLVNGKRFDFPNTAIFSSSRGSSHHRPRLFPWGAGFSEHQYGPVHVPKKGDRVELTAENLSRWRTIIQGEGHSVTFDAAGGVLIDGGPAKEYVVERNYYFVMGDNRDNSLDSRYWGFVPEENLIGEALMVYWSWDPDVAVSDIWDKLNSIRWERIGTLIR
ncbi:MAG TPA: signal peptidase I [Bacteroidota bacterium]|nr:signal peptidase I [Bacteroidota bacterium]